MFHGVSNDDLDKRIADLEVSILRRKQRVAELDESEGELAWLKMAGAERGPGTTQMAGDIQLTSTSKMRSLALSELTTAEQDYRSAAEERDRRQKQHLERKRGDYSSGLI